VKKVPVKWELFSGQICRADTRETLYAASARAAILILSPWSNRKTSTATARKRVVDLDAHAQLLRQVSQLSDQLSVRQARHFIFQTVICAAEIMQLAQFGTTVRSSINFRYSSGKSLINLARCLRTVSTFPS